MTFPAPFLRFLAAGAAAGLLAAASAAAAPVISGPEARAFLGGRAGKIAYLKGFNSQVHFVDFSDSVLVERKVSDDAYCLSPMIHPDGSRVLYEQGLGIWIRDLVGGSASRIEVYSRTVLRAGQTMEPRWWMDPRDSAQYVLFNLGTIEDHVWPPASGGTYMVKLDKSFRPAGTPVLLIPFMMSGGRSRDGRWGGTSHHSTGMYKLHADRNENAFFDATNWMESGAILACNASISPSKDPLRMDRMIHLTSGGYPVFDKQYDNHKAVLMRSWTDRSPNEPLWWMGPPGDRCNDDGSGNLFWGSPEWSTDEDYLTATGSKEVIPAVDQGDLYMVRIHMAGENRILRVLKGGSQDFFSHLWVQDGLRAARMRLDKAALSFAAYAKDSVDPAPQTVSVTNAGDGTLPRLQIGPLPAWLQVAVGGNGTNAPTLAVSVARAGLAPGEHRAKVPVTFGAGVDSAAFEVVFRYSDPVLTSLRPFHPRPVVAAGDTVRLRAEALDQAGRPMPEQPAVAWTGIDALKPAADGLFRADSVPWRAYRVVGRSGAVACTVLVTVTRKLLRVDAGAADGSPAAGWEPESAYVRGGTRGSVPDSVRLAPVAGGAPGPAFRTWRQGASGYAFPDLPNGRYHVRLHWVSASPGTSGGAGTVSARFEGAPLLEAYALPAAPDTAVRAADLREVPVTVSDGNGLAIEMTAWTGPAALAALEIYDVGITPVGVSTPNGGETYRVGDTVVIRWDTDSSITSCGITLSVDSGASWLPLTRRRSVGTSDPDWEAFSFAIPDSLDGRSLVGEKAMITVYDYFGTDRDRSDRTFAILGRAVPVAPRPVRAAPAVAALPGGILRVDLAGLPGAFAAELRDLRGQSAASFRLEGARSHRLAPAGLPRGVYRLVLRGPGLARSFPLTWCP